MLVLALAVGYLSADLFVGLPTRLTGAIPTPVATGVVVVQALALTFRHQAPVAVFVALVLLDALLLFTTSGELGSGAVAVMIATYAVLRHGDARSRYIVVSFGAMVTLLVGTIAMALAGSFPVLAILAFAVSRLILQYVVPAALAEAFRSGAMIVEALRNGAEIAAREHQREHLQNLEREITGLRTAMARELHDIAAHHLSGIIVGAQAGSALITTDPERTREMLSVVQQDARTTLDDLRQAVELLRGDSHNDSRSQLELAATPSISRIASIVQAATCRGQLVDLSVDGDPCPLGPLAEIAGYRMVQESLANAARHAPGAPSSVHIEHLPDTLRITVHNIASAETMAAAFPTHVNGGYGISGMYERASLAGGRLTTERLANGAWRNVLEIPVTKRGARSDPTSHR